jgi:hypothetical protein
MRPNQAHGVPYFAFEETWDRTNVNELPHGAKEIVILQMPSEWITNRERYAK